MMDMHDDHDVEKPKSKPWLGYYDFLITEGSYKFWVVFEVSAFGLHSKIYYYLFLICILHFSSSQQPYSFTRRLQLYIMPSTQSTITKAMTITFSVDKLAQCRLHKLLSWAYQSKHTYGFSMLLLIITINTPDYPQSADPRIDRTTTSQIQIPYSKVIDLLREQQVNARRLNFSL